jgi:hypothetical protein
MRISMSLASHFVRWFACMLITAACGGPSNGDDDGSEATTATPSTSSTSSTPDPDSGEPGSSSGSVGDSGSDVGSTTQPSDDTGTSTGDPDPLELAGEMNGYRWELPCADPSLLDTCAWDPSLLDGAIDDPEFTLHRETVVMFGGDPTVTYDVELRIRGLTEPKDFSGGEVQQQYFQIGGTPGDNDYNIYSITVGDPAQVYTLNRNEMGTGHYTFMLDYTVTIPIRGGTAVTMAMFDPNDIAIANPGGASGASEPYVVPEIPPFPEPFHGQFIQMDVLSVVASG